MINKNNYIVAIDQGSTSTRTVIYDHKLNLINSSQRKTKEIYPDNGWVEQDPEEILITVRETLIEAINIPEINKENILSIGITNQRESIVFWNKETLLPLSPAISWQCLRGIELCKNIKGSKLESIINKSTGLKVDPYFSFSKIVWALKNIEALSDTENICVGTIDSWLLTNLVEGNPHLTEITNASRTGLYNTEKEEWDDEILGLLNIPRSILPKVVQSNYNFGFLSKDILGKKIPINSILGDQQASLFGHKQDQLMEIKCTYGTGGFLLIDTGQERYDSNQNFLSTIASKIDKKTTHALEGSILSAGSLIEWLKNINIFENNDQIEESLNQSEFTETLIIPALNGLGAPFWNAKIRTSIENINSSTSKHDILRAGFESVAFSTKSIIETIENTIDYKIRSIKIDGGLSQSKFFNQFLSDLLSIEVKVAQNSEMTSLGVAKLSLLKDSKVSKDYDDYNNFLPQKGSYKKINKKYNNWKNLINTKINKG